MQTIAITNQRLVTFLLILLIIIVALIITEIVFGFLMMRGGMMMGLSGQAINDMMSTSTEMMQNMQGH